MAGEVWGLLEGSGGVWEVFGVVQHNTALKTPPPGALPVPQDDPPAPQGESQPYELTPTHLR